MMPGASSSQDATYVSIKFSEKTTAEEVIAHIKKKKQLPEAIRFELAYLPNTSTTPSCYRSESIVLRGPAIISDIVSKVASQGEGLWWLRESHEDSIVRLVRRDTFNASKGDPDLVSSLRAMIIAEDAEAEADTPIREEADMAPALKEDTFVARIMKQNSMEQRRPQLDSEVVASSHGQDPIAEDAEAEGATPILEEADMALALKETTFVTRLIRQNSMQQRRPQRPAELSSDASPGHMESFAEQDDAVDEL